MLLRAIPQRKIVFLFVALGGFLHFCATASAQTTAGANAKKVTLEAEWIPLHRLVDKIAAASGMTLTTDLKEGASATPMAVYVKDAPFAEVADALVSCLSARRAEWRWERADDPEGKTVAPDEMKPGTLYRLRCPVAARNYAAKVRARILNDLAGEAQSVSADTDNFPLFRSDDANPFRLAGETGADAATRKAAGFFAGLGPVQQERLLQGDVVEKLLDSVDSSVAPSLETYARKRNAVQQRNVPPDPYTDSPSPPRFFAGARMRRDGRAVTPSLNIYAGIVVRGKGGGYSAPFPIVSVGSAAFNARWGAALIREWTPPETETGAALTAPGKPDSSPAPELRVATPPLVRVYEAAPDTPPQRFEDDLTDALLLLHREAKIQIIARLPLKQGKETGLAASQGDKTLGGFRADLLNSLATATRWHRKILLANPLNAVWETAPEHLCPPAFLAALRRERDNDRVGCLSFETLCAASRLSPEALRSLSEEFPVMEEIVRWRPFLNLLANDANLRGQIQREPGLSVAKNPVLMEAYGQIYRQKGESHISEDVFMEDAQKEATERARLQTPEPANPNSVSDAPGFLLVDIKEEERGETPRRILRFSTIIRTDDSRSIMGNYLTQEGKKPIPASEKPAPTEKSKP